MNYVIGFIVILFRDDNDIKFHIKTFQVLRTDDQVSFRSSVSTKFDILMYQCCQYAILEEVYKFRDVNLVKVAPHAAYYLLYFCENWRIMCFAFFKCKFLWSFAKYSNITIILFDRYFCVVQ